jgi:predicted small secreted protein
MRRNRISAGVIALIAVGALVLSACRTDAGVAARNIDKAAEQFEINRHIVFYNGITDTVFLEVFGHCSYSNQEIEIEVICRDVDGIGGFSNHSMGLSDNVTYVVEQIEPTDVSTTRPRIIFKPEALIPNIDRP